jgi:hypothetical protein
MVVRSGRLRLGHAHARLRAAAALPLGWHNMLGAEISRLKVPDVAHARELSCEIGLALG